MSLPAGGTSPTPSKRERKKEVKLKTERDKEMAPSLERKDYVPPEAQVPPDGTAAKLPASAEESDSSSYSSDSTVSSSSSSKDSPMEVDKESYQTPKKKHLTKRRRATDSERENSPPKKSNRFSQLDSSPDREKKPPKAKPTKKAPRFPPFNVIIDDVKKSFTDLQSLIKASCKYPPVIINKPRTQEMAVCAANLDDYRALQKALEEGKFNFYTFKDPTAPPPPPPPPNQGSNPPSANLDFRGGNQG